MENYQAFLDRINAFEKPELQLGDSDFSVNDSVALKVCEDNTFRKFYGDTVVFDLAEDEKAAVQAYADALYREVPECFCEKLTGSTFHMTLHDLSNSPVQEEVSACMTANAQKLKELLTTHPVERQTIQMRSKAMFNMVNTSLVIGLYPVSAEEYHKLMELYHLIDAVRELPYPLTPHITLAYYNRKGFSRSAAQRLKQIISRMNTNTLEICLDTERLVYQHFDSMNAYHTVLYLTK